MAAPLHPCTRCRRALVPRGTARCQPCEQKHQRADVAYRGTAGDRGYDSRWRALRLKYASTHPLCELHIDSGCTGRTDIVDHRVPHRGDDALRLDWHNLEGACRHCHTLKTRTEGTGYRAPTRTGG